MATENIGSEKKTATSIVIERFLKDVEEKGTMPWQRPYERYNAFNYFSKKSYHGINRLILPFGEYITRNQINTYNKEHGEDFRFQKGIEWFPVVYFKREVKRCDKAEIAEKFPDFEGSLKDGETKFVGRDYFWTYFWTDSGFFKQRNILRYYEVADRKWFKNSKGEVLPSRIELGEVVVELQDPKEVINSYVDRSGVRVESEGYAGTPCYYPTLDLVQLNPYTKDQESWFSTAFHEFAHSTGHASRLNREGIVGDYDKGTNEYAVEECIAEICASLCCAETGVYSFETSGNAHYENNLAYVQHWKKRVKDWGSSFFYIVSQADKAFNYICGDPDSSNEAEEGEA